VASRAYTAAHTCAPTAPFFISYSDEHRLYLTFLACASLLATHLNGRLRVMEGGRLEEENDGEGGVTMRLKNISAAIT